MPGFAARREAGRRLTCEAGEAGRRLTCEAGASTSSRRKAWVGGAGPAPCPTAVTVTVTTLPGAAESGTSSHRRPQADSFSPS